jgi:dTMP kinase
MIKALRGKLIVFEGIDHSGKSTIVNELYNDLLYRNIKTIKTFQPGDNDEDYNQTLKDMCKTKKYNLDPLTNLFAFMTDRSENTVKIKRYLNDGHTVLVDRWWYSTIAYQFHGKELLEKYSLDKEFAYRLNKLASHDLVPDYSFYLERKDITDKDDSKDLFETESNMFKKRVKEAYLNMVDNKELIPIVVDNDVNVTKSRIISYIFNKEKD